MYLRFVLPTTNAESGVNEGVFAAAYDLRENGGVSGTSLEELSALLSWFSANLVIPKRFNRTKSKGHYRRSTKGISWFKPSATEHLSKMHRIVAILEDNGHHPNMIKIKNPGYIVYEDEFQVVAEPFNEKIR